MDLDKLLNLLELTTADLTEHKHTFVPYLYIDGHRSSGVSNDDVESYKSGIDFFLRFSKIIKELGFKEIVTMVHTNRNKAVAGRVHAIQKAIQEGLDLSDSIVANSRFKIYGNLDEYLSNGSRKFYDYLTSVIEDTSRNTDFTHHILINYSEDWAISNLGTINNLPRISSVIRFTKGFVSGGWIPLKMQETTFVYSQLPSVSEFWSDEAIYALILISFKNWINIKDFIGTKIYSSVEKALTHKQRDIELSYDVINLNLPSPLKNRIISFGINGPTTYEL